MAGMEKILFDMRFTAKQLLRESSKCEKKQKAEVGMSGAAVAPLAASRVRVGGAICGGNPRHHLAGRRTSNAAASVIPHERANLLAECTLEPASPLTVPQPPPQEKKVLECTQKGQSMVRSRGDRSADPARRIGCMPPAWQGGTWANTTRSPLTETPLALVPPQEFIRLHGANAVREKNQALNFMRLSSRIDAVAARCGETCGALGGEGRRPRGC